MSFSGKYLPHNYSVVPAPGQDGKRPCNNKLYKINIVNSDPNLFGPAFVEVPIFWGYTFLQVALFLRIIWSSSNPFVGWKWIWPIKFHTSNNWRWSYLFRNEINRAEVQRYTLSRGTRSYRMLFFDLLLQGFRREAEQFYRTPVRYCMVSEGALFRMHWAKCEPMSDKKIQQSIELSDTE